MSFHSKITSIIVHCSASPDSRDVDIEDIDQWHEERGFQAHFGSRTVHCGYHAIVLRDGSLQLGRPERVVGAHVRGHNTCSLSICWIGTDYMTHLQRETLLKWVTNKLFAYSLPVEAVKGHCEYTSLKTCPNFESENTFESMDSFRDELTNYFTGGNNGPD